MISAPEICGDVNGDKTITARELVGDVNGDYTLAAPDVFKPVLIANSTARVKTKLCNGDIILCSNFDNTLSYQWELGGASINGQTGNMFTLPANGEGMYTLNVKNTINGCQNKSAVLIIQEYPTITPIIYEKKKSAIVSLLVVDNTSKAFQTYKWTYADGSELPANMATTNQFLVLSPERMNAEYKVSISDTNSCKQLSAHKSVTLKSAEILVYPTVASGNFKINFVSPEKGNANIQVVNSMGVVMQKLTVFKSSIMETYDLNLKNVPNGAYFIELQMGEFKDTKRVIVLK